MTKGGTVIGLFKAGHLKGMYHMLDPELEYSEEFVKKIVQTEENNKK